MSETLTIGIIGTVPVIFIVGFHLFRDRLQRLEKWEMESCFGKVKILLKIIEKFIHKLCKNQIGLFTFAVY